MARTQTLTPKSYTPMPGTKTDGPVDSASYDRIARRAYEIFKARGEADGDSVQDWLQAERELRLGRH